MLGIFALFALVAASGWWGRYEFPIGAAVAAGVLYTLTTADTFPAVEAGLLGLLVAAMRRWSLPDFGQGRNHRSDVG